jgi:hypothetical protein
MFTFSSISESNKSNESRKLDAKLASLYPCSSLYQQYVPWGNNRHLVPLAGAPWWIQNILFLPKSRVPPQPDRRTSYTILVNVPHPRWLAFSAAPDPQSTSKRKQTGIWEESRQGQRKWARWSVHRQKYQSDPPPGSHHCQVL